MENLLYFGEVNLYWVLFYGCYWLLFRKHTFFRWNRIYLIGVLIFSFALPFIKFPETSRTVSVPVSVYNATISVKRAPAVVMVNSEIRNPAVPLLQAIGILYLIGVSFMFAKFLKGFFQLAKVIRESDCLKFEAYKLILLAENKSSGTGSFSFFQWLFVSRDDYENNLDTILRHETIHIKQWHSLDIMLIETLKIAFWFNPVLWFYKRSIQEIHEFLADQEAPNRDRYATFLLVYALNSPVKSLTNHFFNSSLLKSRIKMIYKTRTSRWLLGKYLMIVPIVLIVITLTSARKHLRIPLVENIAMPVKEKPDRTEMPGVKQNIVLPASSTLKKAEGMSDEKISVTGIVKNENGNFVPNASIILRGTMQGTVTDEDGKFELKNVPTFSSLVVSHVSYKASEIRVGRWKGDYSVKLLPVENIISGLVVTGYAPAKNDIVNEENVKNTSSTKQVFVAVEQKAEFPGGDVEMMKYLAQNIKYPSEAARVRVGGVVLVSFLVNENGEIRRPKIIKGLGYGIDDEAIRVILNMPNWKPAIQNGKTLTSKYTIDIKFNIDSI